MTTLCICVYVFVPFPRSRETSVAFPLLPSYALILPVLVGRDVRSFYRLRFAFVIRGRIQFLSRFSMYLNAG